MTIFQQLMTFVGKNFLMCHMLDLGTYLFWFCPITWAFHLIQGGDFACGLSECSLNREPKYFLETRFWHDLFHSFTHTCGKCFKSSRICGLAGVNSKICEQFSSYLQCIKYAASHLSQSHFMFFVQFFIYLWNCEKTTKISKYYKCCHRRDKINHTISMSK